MGFKRGGSIAGSSDVLLTALGGTQFLMFEDGVEKWVNAALPSGQNLVGADLWTIDPYGIQSFIGLSDKTMYWGKIAVPSAVTISSYGWWLRSVGNNMDGSSLALYSSDGNLVAGSIVEIGTLMNTGQALGFKKTLLAAPITVPGPFCWVGVYGRRNSPDAASFTSTTATNITEAEVNWGLPVTEARALRHISAQLPGETPPAAIPFAAPALVIGDQIPVVTLYR